MEDLLKAKGSVIVEKPNFGGTFFLALSSNERKNLSSALQAETEKTRAGNICRMLGFSEPTISATQRVDEGDYITVDKDGNASTQTYGRSWMDNSTYYSTAIFSRLGCKK